MKARKDRTEIPWASVEEAKEQIRKNSPERDYNVHYELVTLETGEKALKRVCTPKKEKHD